MTPKKLENFISAVTSAYGLGEAESIKALGGTATPKWAINTATGQYVVRIRPDAFSETSQASFTHQALIQLADEGLPVPRPLANAAGKTLHDFEGSKIEVLEWIEGRIWRGDSRDALRNLGIFLAKFHQALEKMASGSANLPLREDHPDALQPLVDPLLLRAKDRPSSDPIQAINDLLQQGRRELEITLYRSLPRAVIHGDFHPGNVRFQGSEVSAVYDFDYLAIQARSRDIIDALMFFASTRPADFEPDAIRSLTQPFTPNLKASQAVLSGYQSISPLSADEWRALPLLLRSRWVQMRLRGSRKVSPAEQLDFVLTDFFTVIDWLNRAGGKFFTQLHDESSA